MANNQFNILDNYYTNLNIKVEEILKYFNNFNSIDLLFDSHEAYEKYFLLRYLMCIYDDKSEFVSLLSLNNGFVLTKNILINLTEKCDDLEFNKCRGIIISSSYKKTTYNERRINFLLLTFHILNITIPNSIDFRTILIEQNGLKALLELVKNHKFIESLINFEKSYLHNLIFTINWLSKIADVNKTIWNELNAIKILIDYESKFNHAKIFVFMALSNIASDIDIENMSGFNDIIDIISDMTIQSIKYPNGYYKQEFLDEDNKEKYELEVRYVNDQNTNAIVSLTGLLQTLYRLSLNNKKKWELYQRSNLIDSLKKIIYEGFNVEKQYSLEIITQLCFDKNILNDLKIDQKFQNYIQTLSQTKNIDFKRLYKTCDQFLWFFRHDFDKSSVDQDADNNKHIMISYNTASRDQCLKIKSELEKANFKIWIDVNEIHGSSLDSMAKAVENSQCVLMCVTEKYRQSLNCQSEAQYAFRLNKPIIPVIMQKGYASVKGWLGFIIGDKIFIDFTKYEFDDAIKRLKNQIVLITKSIQENQVQAVSQPTLLLSTPVITNKYKTLDWNETTVEKWFCDNKLNDFYDPIKPMNGKNLFQLYQLQIHTPEFFYKSLTKNDKCDIRLLVLFSSLLKELFENES